MSSKFSNDIVLSMQKNPNTMRKDERLMYEVRIGAIVKLQSIFRRFICRCRVLTQLRMRFEKILDPRRRKYFYYDSVKDKSQWSKPLLLRQHDLPVAPTYTKDEAAVMIQRQLLRKVGQRRVRLLYSSIVKELTDESSGLKYYHNEKTGFTAWDLPNFMGGRLHYPEAICVKEDVTDTNNDSMPGKSTKKKVKKNGDGDSSGDDEDENDDDDNDSSESESSEVQRQKRRERRKFPRSKIQSIVDVAEDSLDAEGQFELSLSHCLAERVTSRIYDLTTIESLDLSNNFLTSIHPDIQYLTNLQTLNIRNNWIQHLPKQLEELKQMRNFLAGSNFLSWFPCTFYKMRDIVELDLSHNDFVEMPLEVGNIELLKDLGEWEVGLGILTSMMNLDLSYNKFAAWPQQLEKLSLLLKLNLSNNVLTEVPSLIEGTAKLQHLDLSCNQIRILPEEIYKLRALQWLSLRGNKLTELPICSDVAGNRFERLTFVDISENEIVELGTSIGVFNKVEKFLANKNKIRYVDSAIQSMLSVVELDFSCNSLTELPNSIGWCKSLTSLNVSQNCINQLPTSLSQIKILSSLNVSHNQLTEMPGKFMAMLISLKELDFSHNNVSVLSQTIFTLKKLTHLNCSHNCIVEVHEDIGQLDKSLTFLDLSYNLIESVPDSLAALVLLQYLYLNNNRLTSLPVRISALRRVRKINIKGNLLSSVPLSIRTLTQPVSFDFSWNKIKGHYVDWVKEDEEFDVKSEHVAMPLNTLRRRIAISWDLYRKTTTIVEGMEEGECNEGEDAENLSNSKDIFKGKRNPYRLSWKNLYGLSVPLDLPPELPRESSKKEERKGRRKEIKKAMKAHAEKRSARMAPHLDAFLEFHSLLHRHIFSFAPPVTPPPSYAWAEITDAKKKKGRLPPSDLHAPPEKFHVFDFSCTDLMDVSSTFDAMDPCLIITIGKQTFSTERKKDAGTSASFNASFEIEVSAKDLAAGIQLQVEAVNKNAVGLTTHLGKAGFDLNANVPRYAKNPSVISLDLLHTGKNMKKGQVSLKVLKLDPNEPMCKITIDSLSCWDLVNVGSFLDKMDPCLIITIGKFHTFATERKKDAGTSAKFDEIFEVSLPNKDVIAGVEIEVEAANKSVVGKLTTLGKGKTYLRVLYDHEMEYSIDLRQESSNANVPDKGTVSFRAIVSTPISTSKDVATSVVPQTQVAVKTLESEKKDMEGKIVNFFLRKEKLKTEMQFRSLIHEVTPIGQDKISAVLHIPPPHFILETIDLGLEWSDSINAFFLLAHEISCLVCVNSSEWKKEDNLSASPLKETQENVENKGLGNGDEIEDGNIIKKRENEEGDSLTNPSLNPSSDSNVFPSDEAMPKLDKEKSQLLSLALGEVTPTTSPRPLATPVESGADQIKMLKLPPTKRDACNFSDVPRIMAHPMVLPPPPYPLKLTSLFESMMECYYGLACSLMRRADKLRDCIRTVEKRCHVAGKVGDEVANEDGDVPKTPGTASTTGGNANDEDGMYSPSRPPGYMSVIGIGQRIGDDMEDLVQEQYDEFLETLRVVNEGKKKLAERAAKKSEFLVMGSQTNGGEGEFDSLLDDEDGGSSRPGTREDGGRRGGHRPATREDGTGSRGTTPGARPDTTQSTVTPTPPTPPPSFPELSILEVKETVRYLNCIRSHTLLFALKLLETVSEYLRVEGWDFLSPSFKDEGPERLFGSESTGTSGGFGDCVQLGAMKWRHMSRSLAFQLGKCYMGLGRYNRALQEFASFKKQLQTRQHTRELGILCIHCQLALGQYEEALVSVKTMIENEYVEALIKFPSMVDLMEMDREYGLLFMYGQTYLLHTREKAKVKGDEQYETYDILENGMLEKPRPFSLEVVNGKKTYREAKVWRELKQKKEKEVKEATDAEALKLLKLRISNTKKKYSRILNEAREEMRVYNEKDRIEQEEMKKKAQEEAKTKGKGRAGKR